MPEVTLQRGQPPPLRAVAATERNAESAAWWADGLSGHMPICAPAPLAARWRLSLSTVMQGAVADFDCDTQGETLKVMLRIVEHRTSDPVGNVRGRQHERHAQYGG